MTTGPAMSSLVSFGKNSSQPPKQISSAWVRSWSVDRDSAGKEKIHTDEVTMKPHADWDTQFFASGIFLILPLQGSVFLNSGQLIPVGEFHIGEMEANSVLGISNLGPDTVHLVLVRIDGLQIEAAERYSLKFEQNWVSLRWNSSDPEISAKPMLSFHLGRLAGRQEADLILHAPSLGMVLGGAFEYCNRLMEQGDVIWLPQPMEVEMEALSTEGLILILEVANNSGQSGEFS
jgi:hypothetical protein